MGAAQSKKRRKERKRKKKMHIGISSGFEMPRSASVDVIRNINISASSCNLCQQLRDKTACKSLGSSYLPLKHTCWRGPYDEFGNQHDGYESCPSCSVSTYCLATSSQALEVDTSTMSLNRNLTGRCSKFAQCTSSKFTLLVNINKHQNEHVQDDLTLENHVRYGQCAENKESIKLNFELVTRDTESAEPMTSPAKTTLESMTSPAMTTLEPMTSPAKTRLESMLSPAIKTFESMTSSAMTTLKPMIFPAMTTPEPMTSMTILEPMASPVLTTLETMTSPVLTTLETMTSPAMTTLEPMTSPAMTTPEPMTSPAITTLEPITSSAMTTSESMTSYFKGLTTIRNESQEQIITVQKKVISILEDEDSRLARWKRQKLMTQQLRTLRKHIQQQEAIGSSELVLPFSTINCVQTQELGSRVTFDDTHVEGAGATNNTNPYVADTKENLVGTGSVESSNVFRRSLRSKFSKMSNYRYLDNHPVLSKLQNEQNNRLESMERRMKEIRINAMREADRRRFAEIFPAKEDNAKTDKMLQEAREALEKIKAEKRKRQEVQQQRNGKLAKTCTNLEQTLKNAHNQDFGTNDDSGDIIPVCILPKVRSKDTMYGESVMDHQETQTLQLCEKNRTSCDKNRISCDKNRISCDKNKKSNWMNDAWPNVNLGNPLTWFLLPFLMFPVILRILLSLVISTGNGNNGRQNSRQNSNSSNNNNVETRSKKPHS